MVEAKPRKSRPFLSAMFRAATVCVAIVVITFVLVRIAPGDPVSSIVGPNASLEAREALRKEMHLDEPLAAQFAEYVTGMARADLGTSLANRSLSVNGIIGDTLPVTLALVAVTMMISTALGLVLGLIAAFSRSGMDLLIRATITILLALPAFFVALILMQVFAVNLGLLPAAGWGENWLENLQYLTLPAVALSAYLIPVVARVTRQSAKDALQQPWAEAAVTRGLSQFRLAYRHILPNTMLPVYGLLAYNFGALIAGAVVVEAVFGLPGLGSELVTAVAHRDYPVIQGIATVSALLVVLAFLAADVVVAALDPRIRKS